jgi:hypothetical protein
MTEENKDEQYEVMPGADRPDEESEALDLSFDEVKAAIEEPVEEETVSEDLQSTEEETNEAEEETAEEETVAEAEEEAVEVDEEPTEQPNLAVKKPMVPKSRLDEVLNKQKALQKQLDDMKAAQVPAEDAPDDFDFGVKEVEYQNLLLDGESEKAAALRADIRRAERNQIEYEMTQKMTQTVNQNQQATALQQAATDLEASFPVFDQAASEYNAEYTQEVIDLRDAFMTKGDNAVAALSKAARYVVREYDLEGAVETPSLAGKAAPKSDEMAKKRAEVSRKLKAADAQPPELPGESSASRGEKGLDLSSMTEEEFGSLPEATLKRLRGDII